MSFPRMLAVGLVFLFACAGWWILGAATAVRSSDLFGRLGGQVESLWGTPLVQQAPAFSVNVPGSQQTRPVMPSKNEIKVGLTTDYRKKGLMWFSTYNCSFDGTYTIKNSEEVAQKICVHFDFPSKSGTYDNFSATLSGKSLNIPVNTQDGISEIIELAPGESKEIRLTYRTRGLNNWHYKMDPKVGRVQNLSLVVTTDFEAVDYPEGSLSAMDTQKSGKGAILSWTATDLISNDDIGVIIPEKLNPGPLTTRITFFAPVCLLFFFVLVGTINVLYKVDIHPMHYWFVAAGFFAFHLLLSYMAGIINIHLAFAISAVVSVALVTSYMYAALKRQFPWKVAIAGQLFYLVLFSYSFFFKGITGLTIAIGSVITLAVLMRVTADVNWNNVFTGRAKPVSTPPPLPE